MKKMSLVAPVAVDGEPGPVPAEAVPFYVAVGERVGRWDGWLVGPAGSVGAGGVFPDLKADGVSDVFASEVCFLCGVGFQALLRMGCLLEAAGVFRAAVLRALFRYSEGVPLRALRFAAGSAAEGWLDMAAGEPASELGSFAVTAVSIALATLAGAYEIPDSAADFGPCPAVRAAAVRAEEAFVASQEREGGVA